MLFTTHVPALSGYVLRNYVAFVAFFKNEVQKLGVSKALETYIFSETANAGETKMLARLVGGA